ncbi:MAG: periplasmic heavy metal sensor [Thermoanaerobaculia bacterium]
MRGRIGIIGSGVGAAALIALTIGGAALASPGEGHGRHGGRILHRALASLDLSEAQRTKVKALAEQQKGDGQSFREQMRADREALREALEAANPDPMAVGKAMLKVRSSREAGKARLQEFRTKLKPILTPEQNARLDGFLSAVRAEREDRREDRREGRHDGQGQGRHHRGMDDSSR